MWYCLYSHPKINKFIDPENRAVECPSINGIGTAQGLAKVYGIIANGGKVPGGKKLLSEKLIQTIAGDGTVASKDEVLGIPTRFSYGFMRQEYQVCKEGRKKSSKFLS